MEIKKNNMKLLGKLMEISTGKYVYKDLHKYSVRINKRNCLEEII